MYCTRCGRKLPEGSTECPYCRQTAGGSQTAWTGAPAGQAAGRGPENQSAGSGGTKKRKGSAGKRVIVAAGILLLMAAVFGIAAVSYRVVARKQYEEQVSLGERYLEELDYEAAIAAFKEAIRIDPKREEAYLGLAEIYIVQGDYEEAEKILDDAYSVIHTESLKDRMTELEEERREAEEMRRAQQKEASEAEAMQEESWGEADKIPESQSTAGQENQDGEIPFYEHGEITLEGWLEEVQSEHIGGGFESTTYVLHLDQPAIFRVTDWDSEEEYETEIQDSVQVSYEVEGIEEAVGQHVQIRGEVEASQPTAYYIRDVAIYSGVCRVTEDAFRRRALSESELLAITEAEANHGITDYVYIDMDHDGVNELIGVYPDEKNIYQVWYCSSDGETCELVHQSDDGYGMEECDIELLEVGNETHVVVNAYRLAGTGKCYSILALKSQEIICLVSNGYGSVSMTDTDDIKLVVESYDGLYDPVIDAESVHTWKDTYLFYDGSQYKEYGATEISEKEFMEYQNAQEIKDTIEKELWQSNISFLDFSYFRRKNGILHIQCNAYNDLGEIWYGYYTARYVGSELSVDIGEYNPGQMASSFSDLEIVY